MVVLYFIIGVGILCYGLDRFVKSDTNYDVPAAFQRVLGIDHSKPSLVDRWKAKRKLAADEMAAVDAQVEEAKDKS